MTFDTIERSATGRRPVELYRFAREYQAWHYTSADREVIVDSQAYAPKAISRGSISASAETARSTLTLTVPRDLEVADLFRISPPSSPVVFTLRQYHQGDGEVATIWTGRIATVAWRGSTAQIMLEPNYSSLRRAGLRRMFQRSCPHVLYGSACKVNREAYRVDGAADTVSQSVVRVAAAATMADAYFAGGFIEYEVEVGIYERRFITDHTGDALTINAAAHGLAVGQAVRIYPGCDHVIATCQSKFGNALNYGGMPYFTEKNPFGGSPVY